MELKNIIVPAGICCDPSILLQTHRGCVMRMRCKAVSRWRVELRTKPKTFNLEAEAHFLSEGCPLISSS